MDGKTVQKRLLAAQDLLQRGTIDLATFGSVKTLLTGLNPRLDAALVSSEKAIKKVDNIHKGAAIELAIESIPDVTPEQKKRKKAILFFLKFWNDVKAEVARVEKELGDDFSGKSMADKAGAMGAVMGAAKGPLGIVTLIAVAVVALKLTEVTVKIQNVNCSALDPRLPVTLNIPGLSLPNALIAPGETAVAKLPPLDVTVDLSGGSKATLSILGVPYSADAPNRMQFMFNGNVLNNTKSEIHLREKKEHTLVVQC